LASALFPVSQRGGADTKGVRELCLADFELRADGGDRLGVDVINPEGGFFVSAQVGTGFADALEKVLEVGICSLCFAKPHQACRAASSTHPFTSFAAFARPLRFRLSAFQNFSLSARPAPAASPFLTTPGPAAAFAVPDHSPRCSTSPPPPLLVLLVVSSSSSSL
jgi:hypothetical protein